MIILLVSRIVYKAGIVVTQSREKFPTVSTIDRAAILQSHEVHQFAFRSRLLHHIHNLQTVMHQFMYGLSVCVPDILLKIGASMPEMVAQEKVIDAIVALLKTNQMDENSSTDSMYYQTFYNIILSFFI